MLIHKNESMPFYNCKKMERIIIQFKLKGKENSDIITISAL